MSKIKAVAFDAGYTLLRPVWDEWFLPPRLFDFVDRQAWEALDPAIYRRAYQAGYDYLDVIHDQVKTEQQEYEQFLGFFEAFSQQAPQLNMTRPVCEALAEDHTYNDRKFVFYEDVKPALDRLKERYRLGVLSDTWPSLHRIFENYGIRRYFEAFVLSCDVGVFKPDPKIYQALVASFGLEPSQIVFVDDVLENLQGAQKAGIRPVQILRKDLPTGPFPTVKNMAELEALLVNLE